jgi:hypothetical protein
MNKSHCCITFTSIVLALSFIAGPLSSISLSALDRQDMTIATTIEEKNITPQIKSTSGRISSDIIKNKIKQGLRKAYMSYSGMLRATKRNFREEPRGSGKITRDNRQMGINAYLDRLAALSQTRSVTERFGKRSIHSVFDIATGDGEWMINCRTMPWMAKDATILGFEIENVVPYDEYETYHPRELWNDLAIMTDKNDPRYPAQQSIDCVNIGFFDMSRQDALNSVLNMAHAVLRPQGWLILSHNADPHFVRFIQEVIPWLVREGYDIEVLNEVSVPQDYPRSFWWKFFADKPGHNNYLIIARKAPKEQIITSPLTAA